MATVIGDAPAVLAGLPVGPSIAITLRSDMAVAGCADVTDLVSGEVRDLSVKVNDVPVDIAATDLPLTLDMAPDGSKAWPAVEALSHAFVENVFPSNQSEGRRLLDATRAQVPDPDSFAEARLAGGWDALVDAWLDESGELLRDSLAAWIHDGFESLRQGRTVAGHLRATPAGSGYGILALDTLHGLPVEAAGVPKDHVVSLNLDPGDVVIVGGHIRWFPSQMVAAAGNAGAVHQTGVDAAEALVTAAGCDQLAPELDAAYPLPPSCGATCIQKACTAGVHWLWNQAQAKSASTFDIVDLTFTASGTAIVSGDAVIVGIDASWVGTQKHDGEEVALEGDANAGTTAPQTR